MATTNTSQDWFWYIRRKGRRGYLGIVDTDGDAPTGAYNIEIYYDEIPDDLTDNDDTFPIPAQFELGIIKGVAAELMVMAGKSADKALIALFRGEYEDTISKAIHYRNEETAQPLVLKPLDLRDDDGWGGR